MSVQARPQDYAAAIYDLALETWLGQLGDLQVALKNSSLRASLDEPASVQEKLKLLDAAVPDHPVYLQLSFAGPAVTNSPARDFFAARGVPIGDDGRLASPAGEAHGDTRTATDDQHLLGPGNEALDLIERLL